METAALVRESGAKCVTVQADIASDADCATVVETAIAELGRVDILGSTTAGMPQSVYCASKAASTGLTRDLAKQWGERKGIRVNALAPGFFVSEMTDDDYLDLMLPRIPLGRVGEGAELANAAVFLASDASSYITGALLPVDRGLLVN